MEQWKTIIGNDFYEISNFGNVRNIITKKIMKLRDNQGYLIFQSKRNGVAFIKSVHRLVAIHFIDNPNNYPMVNHIDSIKNNNNYKNLEWCTNQMNVDHAVNAGIIPRRPVINTQTGQVIQSVLALSRHLGWSKSKVKHMLTGRATNRSGWVYLTPSHSVAIESEG